MEHHELRVALVLNGGVSLAVWMGGVVHELDLLRRASAPDDAGKPGPQEYDRPVFERWRAESRRTTQPRHVVVDVIAGTSAGGLNGSLLATAVARGGSLDPPDVTPGPWLRQRWAELGALTPGQLLPEPTASVPSVLDGEYFLEELTGVLGAVAQAGDDAASDPVTLFVTSSGLGSQEFTVQDAARQRFTVEDHRFLYQFSNEPRVRYRHGRYETETPTDFDRTTDLAHASRASASFPGAFAPLFETPELGNRPPRLRPRVDTARSWLVDGGVLDNAPFGPVLDVVARRPVNRRATRYILYVVPSSGVGTAGATVGREETPDWRKAVLSAVQYPREVDFRGDVEELERLLLEADASWSDTQQLFDRCVADPEESRRIQEAAALLQPAYVRGRAAGGVWEAITVATGSQATVLDATAALTDNEVTAILAQRPQWIPPAAPGVEPLPTPPDADGAPVWPWGTGPAERVVRLVLRSLRQRLDTATRSVGVDTPDARALASSLARVDTALERVIAVRDALTERIAEAGFKPDDKPEAIAERVNAIFADLAVPEAVGAEIRALVDALPGQVETALAVEIISRCTAARTPPQRSAPFRFLRLGPDVPLPVLDGTTAQQQAADLGDRILFGTQVGHFGGFGAADWRRWDWLMGRLHGAAHLGRLLGENDAWIRDTQLAILQAEDRTLSEVADQIGKLSNAFAPGPGAGQRALLQMRDELNETDTGQATLRGLAERLVAVSGGVSPTAGTWVRALVGRDDHPDRRIQRWARWFAQPARRALWQRLARNTPPGSASPPPLLISWPIVALFLLFAALTAAAVAAHGILAVALGVVGGAVLAATTALLVIRRWLDRKRAWLREKVATLLPELPPTTPR